MAAWYNENDPFAAAWLRELIKAGLIADGEVDERDIQAVSADDVRGFTQCHFFAGIGGWSYALRLAGWPDGRAVWTGSCPCQPFSSSGAKRGFADSRHLWPAWFRLIGERRPSVVLGEQVSSGSGFSWFDHVATDLETLGYAVGSLDLPAASVGAPHRRQRLWWVADADGVRLARLGGQGQARTAERRGLGDAGGEGRRREPEYGDVEGTSRLQPGRSSEGRWWTRSEWVDCGDGRRRIVESGVRPLAHGVPARVGRLRGYGNAIVPYLAAAFIEAYCDVRGLS